MGNAAGSFRQSALAALSDADAAALTELFRDLTEPLRFGSSKDDRALAEHLTFVANRILQEVRKEEWSKRAQKKIGKLLMRLFFVYEAYRAKKGERSLVWWLKRISGIADKL